MPGGLEGEWKGQELCRQEFVWGGEAMQEAVKAELTWDSGSIHSRVPVTLSS